MDKYIIIIGFKYLFLLLKVPGIFSGSPLFIGGSRGGSTGEAHRVAWKSARTRENTNLSGCIQRYLFIWLFQPLWNIWQSVGNILPNIWKNNKCSKPPISIHLVVFYKFIYLFMFFIIHWFFNLYICVCIYVWKICMCLYIWYYTCISKNVLDRVNVYTYRYIEFRICKVWCEWIYMCIYIHTHLPSGGRQEKLVVVF